MAMSRASLDSVVAGLCSAGSSQLALSSCLQHQGEGDGEEGQGQP